MATTIRIDVVRGDGEVTRLVGQSGIAVCAPPLDRDVKLSEPALVSVRCSDAAQLAWNLACVLATIRCVSPAAYDSAHELMQYVDARRPSMHRFLPREG